MCTIDRGILLTVCSITATASTPTPEDRFYCTLKCIFLCKLVTTSKTSSDLQEGETNSAKGILIILI